MSTALIVIIFIFRCITLILASIILRQSYLRFKQFQSQDSRSFYVFLLFGIGIFVYTIGDALEEVLFEFTNIQLAVLHTVEAILNALGFGIIIYSIYKS